MLRGPEAETWRQLAEQTAFSARGRVCEGCVGGRQREVCAVSHRRRSETVSAAFRAASASRPGSSRRRGCSGGWSGRAFVSWVRIPSPGAARGKPTEVITPRRRSEIPGIPPAPRAADTQVRRLRCQDLPGARGRRKPGGSLGCFLAIESHR